MRYLLNVLNTDRHSTKAVAVPTSQNTGVIQRDRMSVLAAGTPLSAQLRDRRLS